MVLYYPGVGPIDFGNYYTKDEIDAILGGYATDADIQTLIEGYGYQTAQDVDDAIAGAMTGITSLGFEVVETLPATGEAGKIYLIANAGSGDDSYNEYIYVNNRFEKIGTAALDLSGYVQASEMHALTNAEIDTIFGEVFNS